VRPGAFAEFQGMHAECIDNVNLLPSDHQYRRRSESPSCCSTIVAVRPEPLGWKDSGQEKLGASLIETRRGSLRVRVHGAPSAPSINRKNKGVEGDG
jgi:hypothetical protein